MKRYCLLLCLMGLLLPSCRQSPPPPGETFPKDLPYEAPTTVFPDTGWVNASPESLGVTPDSLMAALEYLSQYCKEDGLEETMIVRHGRVIWSGDSLAKVHDIWSCTKSFVSTAAGLMAAEGLLDLDQPVAVHEPLLAEQYPNATYRHFLTMTSGYNARGSTRWPGDVSEDWSATPFTPAAPLFEPGTAFAYWDEAMIMLGRALTKVSEVSLENYLAETLLYPIGIEDWSWWYEEALPDGTPINFGGTGLKMCALDQARFGLLFLNDGVWNGQRILPEGWVAEATANQVPTSLALADTDRQSTDGRGIYGYNWWVINEGTDAPVAGAFTSGLNHNVCLIIPAWDMVIVRQGVDGNPDDISKHALYSEIIRILDGGVRY
ncbi:serine hydrolase [Lewinella sp. W8]|uniref:serine hydrolase domain-containing protein n=1 Tax=Lewinella sp. W8 TaxID=2528208 RepID=UPI0010679D1C|nr:serine hydrolase [Lewinella sp. W8]MTB51395.1 serine hydrolase [Lewinella sp. W8]